MRTKEQIIEVLTDDLPKLHGIRERAKRNLQKMSVYDLENLYSKRVTQS